MRVCAQAVGGLVEAELRLKRQIIWRAHVLALKPAQIKFARGDSNCVEAGGTNGIVLVVFAEVVGEAFWGGDF